MISVILLTVGADFFTFQNKHRPKKAFSGGRRWRGTSRM